MKITKIIKLFTLAIVVFFGMFLNCHAEESNNITTLSQIVIDENIDNNFNVNLVFAEKYTENAFIQKLQNGSYNIFIPDTNIEKRGIKVLYRNPRDKGSIKLHIQNLPYMKDNYESNYTRIAVDIIGNNTIQLYSKTLDDIALDPVIHKFNKYYIFILLLSLIAGLLLWKIIATFINNNKKTKTNIYKNTNIIPFKLIEPNTLDKGTATETKAEAERKTQANITVPITENKENHVLPKLNIKKSLKTSEGDSFSCFDIPFVDAVLPSIEIKKQVNALKSKVSNPINASKVDEASEFSLPVVEDIIENKKPKKIQEIKKNEPELLSELRITPRKGFYLTTINDTFSLFGFVDSNVFLLKTFNDLSQINLQARFYDRQQNTDTYIVKLDTYKALIEISNNGMKELAVL